VCARTTSNASSRSARDRIGETAVILGQQYPHSGALAAAAHDSMVTFLRIELQIANTVLDAAATTNDDEARERRRARANEACAEVVRYFELIPQGEHGPSLPRKAGPR
jgi:hypothetical protein